MPIVCGIYGYQITRPMQLFRVRIEPRTSDLDESRLLARDLSAYNLTATLTGDAVDLDFLFNLEAVLSFIEHLDVVITQPTEFRQGEPLPPLPMIFAATKRHGGGGAVVGESAFLRTSREQFVLLAMQHLQDKAFCERTQFNILFFKCVETFRQRKPFIEVTYFLLYSGLESFARSVVGDKKGKSSSKPILRLLTSYGFAVDMKNSTEFHRAVSTYTILRNALFHNSEREGSTTANGSTVKLLLVDYLFSFEMLVSLTVMKAIGFDDGHTNWNAWSDRQLFK